ncbi:MAG: riboflavin biosynthesis protein RibF, partial [Chloroflexi bacterium]|nr:riboflavin biosynthesis protein RibF [Chloroflexota bacterium]
TVALTFDRHPRLALAGSPEAGCITDLAEKLDLLEKLGVDLCALIPVASGLLELEAADFVEKFLVRRLGCRLIVTGYDFRFGRNRAGDIGLLRSLGERHGYTVVEAPVALVDGEPVKSTRIRAALLEGDMVAAARMMGRRYQVNGRVVAGQRLGRTLGFPTANLDPSPEKLLPQPGVYAGCCWLKGQSWPAAINFGVRPTIGGETRALEAHLLGFTGDLYGEVVKLEFAVRLRNEERFAGVEALRKQIGRDIEAVQRWSEREMVDGWSGPDDPSHVTLV